MKCWEFCRSKKCGFLTTDCGPWNETVTTVEVAMVEIMITAATTKTDNRNKQAKRKVL
jgi:hypothetical protein